MIKCPVSPTLFQGERIDVTEGAVTPTVTSGVEPWNLGHLSMQRCYGIGRRIQDWRIRGLGRISRAVRLVIVPPPSRPHRSTSFVLPLVIFVLLVCSDCREILLVINKYWFAGDLCGWCHFIMIVLESPPLVRNRKESTNSGIVH